MSFSLNIQPVNTYMCVVRSPIDLKGQRKVVVIYADLSNAFDCDDYARLLQKLSNNFDCRPNTISLFSSYPINRSQVITHHGHLSRCLNTILGVSKLTQVGPLFRILFVNGKNS